MKKHFVFALVLLLTVALLAGCGSKPDEALAGTWQGILPLSRLLGEQEQSVLDLPATVSFFADGTYALTVDTSGITEQMDEISQNVESIGKDAKGGLEQILKAAGVENQTLTQVLKWLFPEKTDKEDSEQKGTVINGRYKTEDGKLYLSLVKVVGIYSDSYLSYTVEDGALTIDALAGGQSELTNILGKLLPITLQKAE